MTAATLAPVVTATKCAITPWCTDRAHSGLEVDTSGFDLGYVMCQRAVGEKSFDNDHRIIEVTIQQEKTLGGHQSGSDAWSACFDGKPSIEIYDFTDDDATRLELTTTEARQLTAILKTIGESTWLAETLATAVATLTETEVTR